MQSSELKEIYNDIIVIEAERILNENMGLLLIPNAFELLWAEYIALHDYYAKKYMHPNSKGLDTHKEISTVVIALLKTKILKTVDVTYYDAATMRHAFNETLAFRVGCDILKSAIACDYQNNRSITSKEASFCIDKINQGISLPQTSYQSYQQTTIMEFYFTSREGSYNFLGLADKFFWIEYFNKRRIKQKYNSAQKH